MRLTGNNKGATLVELIIAMAVAAIVLSMIMYFIFGAAKSFQRTSDEVNLQLEAQTAINQINNIILEAGDMEVYPSDGLINPITGDIRYTFHCNNNEFYSFIFVEADRMLYQVQTTGFVEARTVTYNRQENLLADYVKELSISKVDRNKSAKIDLLLALGPEEYRVSKLVKMRNAK